MTKITIDYSIPTSKEDISLEDWLKFEKIANEEGVEPEFLQKKMLEIFCNLSLEHAHQLKQIDLDEIMNNLNNVLGVQSELTTRFTFKGVEYGLIPDFDKHIKAGENIDLEKYLELKDYPRLLSILYRPITVDVAGLYQIEPYLATHTKFSELRYDILEGVLAFFLRSYEKLIIATLRYSQKEMMKMEMNSTYQEKVNSLLSGVDIPKSFGYSQKKM